MSKVRFIIIDPHMNTIEVSQRALIGIQLKCTDEVTPLKSHKSFKELDKEIHDYIRRYKDGSC